MRLGRLGTWAESTETVAFVKRGRLYMASPRFGSPCIQLGGAHQFISQLFDLTLRICDERAYRFCNPHQINSHHSASTQSDY